MSNGQINATTAPAQTNGTLGEFLNPKSMITPALAGALTMMITNCLCSQFQLSQLWQPRVGIFVSCLFSLIVVAATKMVFWQRLAFFAINALVIFTMALGSNTAGVELSKTPLKPLAGLSLPTSKGLLVKEAFAQQSFPDGALIKDSSPEVYIIINGQRRWIPDPNTFDALGLNRKMIQTLPTNIVAAVPRGPDYPSLPGQLVKGSGPKVYLLQNGMRSWIPDPETLEALGYQWKYVNVIPDGALNQVPEGPPIQAKKRFFKSWFK